MRFSKVKGFTGGSDGKESICNARDLGSVPGLGRCPGGRHGNPLQYSCLENVHGQRSLAGYSPWGCKGSDMTEWLSTHKVNNLSECHLANTWTSQDSNCGPSGSNASALSSPPCHTLPTEQQSSLLCPHCNPHACKQLINSERKTESSENKHQKCITNSWQFL